MQSLRHLKPLRLAAPRALNSTTRVTVRQASSSSNNNNNSGSSGAAQKRGDLLDRESMNTTSTEGAQTGAGDAGAAQADTAFEPGNTDPGAQVEGVEKELGQGASPANVSAGSGVNEDAVRMKQHAGTPKEEGGSEGKRQKQGKK